MRSHRFQICAMASSINLVLAACSGGGIAGLASSPPSVTNPAPILAPTPTQPVALQAPVQSKTPEIVFAAPTGPNIWEYPAHEIALPVTQTAIDTNFNGDPYDTSQDKAFFPNLLGDGPFLSYTGGGWNLAAVAQAYLDWTAFGYWDPFNASRLPNTSRGAWLAGFETPVGSIPIAGSATYQGGVSGLASESHLCNCNSVGVVNGQVSVTANLGSGSLSGAMTSLTVSSTVNPSGQLNSISFSASLVSGENLFTGTTAVSSAPGGPWALDANAKGDLTGHFFGPDAREIGAVWTLSDGVRSLIGSFGAEKN